MPLYLYERCCLCAADVQALAGVFFVLGKVAGFRTAYGVVQGIAVLLSIVRLVDMMAAHQRFAVLPRALALVSCAPLWSCMHGLKADDVTPSISPVPCSAAQGAGVGELLSACIWCSQCGFHVLNGVLQT